MQDLIAIGLPYMGIMAILVICAALVYDPSMRLLLYTALPSRLQNWATFGLCLLEEIRFLVVFAAIGIPVLQLQVIIFNNILLLIRLIDLTAVHSICTEMILIHYRSSLLTS